MAEGEPAGDGGTQEACEQACDCFCLPKPYLFPDRVSTPQGEYAVAASGEVAAGPVLHPADLVARDVGYDIDTAPQYVVSLEHLRRDATLTETAPVETVLDASRQPLVPVPVEGITPLVPVEVLGAEAVVPVELPRGSTSGAVTDAPAEHALPTLADLPSRPAPARGRTATERAEGKIASGLPDPLRGVSAAFMEPGRIVTGELRSGPDDLLFPVQNVDPEIPPSPEEEDGQPSTPPASTGSGTGSSTPADEEEEGGGGGGGRRFTPPDLGRAPPAPERPEPPGVQRPLSPPQHALGPADAAPVTLAPSLHPSAPAGSRVLVPGGMVAPTPTPPKPTGRIPVPGGLAAPKLQNPPTTETRQRFGSQALPFAAPPATAPLTPDPRQLPPPVTPPALSLPPTASDKRRASSTTAFTESLTAGARAREAIEPGPAGGPRERVRPAPAKTPGQLSAHVLRRAGASAKPVGSYVSPQMYGAVAVLLPQDAELAVEQPEALPEPRRDLEPRLVAPEHGAVSGSFPAEPTLPVAVAPATLSDDHLALLTAPLVAGATVVPDGSFGSVGGAAMPASTPPPQVAGGSRSQPSVRGKPSGKVGLYAQLYAQLDPVADEAERLLHAATALDELAAGARKEEARQQAIFDAEVAKEQSGAAFDKDAILAARDASSRAHSEAVAAERDAALVRQEGEATQRIADQIGGELDVVLGDILEENPQTGQAIATAAAKRQLERARKEAQKRSRPYYRNRDARKRSKERFKEAKLDAKKRRKLSAADYQTWREKQDDVEAAKDHRALSELREKEEQGRLTPAERREKKEIEKREEKRDARARDRAKEEEKKAGGGVPHAPDEPAQDEAPAAPAAPEPDPCAGCTCDPPCAEDADCICVPRAEEPEAAKGGRETPGGHQYTAPPDSLPPEPPPALTKTIPAPRREPPRHPDAVELPPSRLARDPCTELRAECRELARDEHWLHELEGHRVLELLRLELQRMIARGLKHSSGGPDLAEWKALEEAIDSVPPTPFPLGEVREYARRRPGRKDDPCKVYLDCLQMRTQLEAWEDALVEQHHILGLIAVGLHLKKRIDGHVDDHILDVALNPLGSMLAALFSGDVHKKLMDLCRTLTHRGEGWERDAARQLDLISATTSTWEVRFAIGQAIDLLLQAAFIARSAITGIRAIREWLKSGRKAVRRTRTTPGASASDAPARESPPLRPPDSAPRGGTTPAGTAAPRPNPSGGRPIAPEGTRPMQPKAAPRGAEKTPKPKDPEAGATPEGAPTQPNPARDRVRPQNEDPGSGSRGKTASRRSPPGEGGRGLIGLVKPRGTIDDTLRDVYLQIAKSPQMASAVERYNRLARFVRQRPSASIDDIVDALGKDVTFSRIGTLRSGVFVPGKHPGSMKFWIQGNPTTAYGERVARHELVHLGAALKGQRDTFLHEVAVQAATTPEGLAISAGMVVAAGGAVYWVASE